MQEYTASHMSDKGIVFRICKKHNSWETNQSRSGQKSWIHIFPKKICKWPTGMWKWYPTSLVIAVLCSLTQLCLTQCDPMGCSPPGSSVHGISQARVLEWIAIFYSRRSSNLEPESLRPPAVAAGFFTTMPPGHPLDIREMQIKIIMSVGEE